jgi:hypothetical protein
MRTTERKFKVPTGFEPAIYFDDSFGIIVDENNDPCTVEIKVFGNQRKYFNALPLHSSQEEITTTDEYAVFRYFLRPTYDFRQELLSHGAEIEILSPVWFRDEMRAITLEMNKLYQ